MSRTMNISIAVIAFLIAIVLLWRSGNDEDRVRMETDTGTISVNSNERGGVVTFKGKGDDAFNLAFSKEVLAKNFPEDIPIYTGSSVESSHVWDGGKSVGAMLITDKKVAEVADYYLSAMPDAGWALVDEEFNRTPHFSGGVFLLEGRKEGYVLRAHIAGEENGTHISLARDQVE